MAIHVRTVRVEPSKKALRKRRMRKIRGQVIKYGLIAGVFLAGYSVYQGGLPDQIAAMKRMTSDAVSLVSSPVTDGKKNVNLYVNKANANKAAYDAEVMD